jgi:hypothetical protein
MFVNNMTAIAREKAIRMYLEESFNFNQIAVIAIIGFHLSTIKKLHTTLQRDFGCMVLAAFIYSPYLTIFEQCCIFKIFFF